MTKNQTPDPADLSSLPFFAPPAQQPVQPPQEQSAAASHLLRAATRQAPVAAPAQPTQDAYPARLAYAVAEPVFPPTQPPAAPTSRRSASSTFEDQGRIPWEAVAEFRDAVSVILADAGQADPTLTDEDREILARQHTAELIRARVDDLARRGQAPWTLDQQQDVAQAVFDAMFRLGRLQPLVDIDDVENIDIVGHDNVWITLAGGDRRRYPHPVAVSDDELEREINFIATRRGEGARSFNASRPSLHLDLPGGARLAALARPIAERPSITIRVHRHVDISLDDLIATHTLTPVAAKFLDAAVRAGLSLVTNGFQSSGKTTLLRALADCIPPEEKLATIEMERELYLHKNPVKHPLVIAFEYRPGEGEPGVNGERAGEFPLIRGLEDSLRHTTDRLIVGEVRGSEINAMLQAMQSGVGSMSTLHSQSPEDAIERMVTLMMKDGSNATPAYCYRQIAQNIDLIVQMAKIRDAETGKSRRVVTSISEIQPGEDSYGVARPTLNKLFVFDRDSQTLELGNLPSRELLEKLVEVGFNERELSPYTGEANS
jgi:Flp pilus assembly CpaF family ATPase